MQAAIVLSKVRAKVRMYERVVWTGGVDRWCGRVGGVWTGNVVWTGGVDGWCGRVWCGRDGDVDGWCGWVVLGWCGRAVWTGVVWTAEVRTGVVWTGGVWTGSGRVVRKMLKTCDM